MAEKIKVWRLDFANILCKDSILTLNGDPETFTLIGCFAYLIKANDEYILVDCGIEDIDIVNKTKSSKDDWKRGATDGDILWNLERIGVSPESVKKIFLTHTHYDHFSGVVHFPNAKIYISAKEYEYLQRAEHPHRKYLDDAVTFLENKKENGDLHLVENHYEESRIGCKVIGGHTPGSMMVCVGEFLFAGDLVYLLENIKNEIPIGFCMEPDKAKIAVSLCREHNGVVLTGHDLKCPVIAEL